MRFQTFTMSRPRGDLRPSVTKLTVKGTLPSISHDKDKVFADSIKGHGLDISNSQLSASSSRRKSHEKRENLDHLLKEIEVCEFFFYQKQETKQTM